MANRRGICEFVNKVNDFILGGSKITAVGDCTHEIKTLAPWKESYDQPREYIKMQRYYLANRGPSSQSYGFSSSHVWIRELDYIKKAKCRRFDAFELWCWRRFLRVPWTQGDQTSQS